jgi:hypothetical protein
MARKREREVFELPVTYCRDNAEVQAFVDERVWDFNPFRIPETSRDILDAAIIEFGLLPCFYFEIRLH